jgi:secreted PhoX family phosphatase
MQTRGSQFDRRAALRLMGMGLVSSAAVPWLASCSSDDDGASGGPTTGASTTAGPTTTTRPPGPVGLLGEPDANGLQLPEGFTSRIVARSGEEVTGTGYTWHGNPDGGACFAQDDGGWIYVSNCEEAGTGGVSMVRFDPEGEITEAARICDGTSINCAGGATPWDTWLTCEEHPDGRVWECDPRGKEPAVVRPALGTFKHEAVAVDAEAEVLYLSEDEPDGALYRFVPAEWPSLEAGRLEVLAGPEDERRWVEVTDAGGGSASPTRNQVADVVRFNGGEGLAHFEGTTYLATKGDNRIWALDGDDVEIVYDAATTEAMDGTDPVLTGVDNITVDAGGDRYVAEDGGTMDVVRLGPDGLVEPVARLDGVEGSEITGPAFSPDGTRLYFSSQRNPGVTYEVTGPFPHAEPDR